jgi:hypothetical protein
MSEVEAILSFRTDNEAPDGAATPSLAKMKDLATTLKLELSYILLLSSHL